ncbi:MAG: DUF3047 domain-containing protein [Pseudomonadota bacterium]
MRHRLPAALALMLAGAVPHHAAASEGWHLPFEAPVWRTLKIPGARENQFRLNGDALQVISDGSVSFRYMELPRNSVPPATLSWRWRVDRHSPLASQAQKGRDDRPLAIHVWFDTQGRASLFGNLASLTGRPKIGHLLTYVWGATEPAGTVLANPYYDKGRVIVVVGSDGRTGQWRDVRRDVVEDYRRAFGTAPDMSALRYIAISADTDDLSGRSSAFVRALTFDMP